MILSLIAAASLAQTSDGDVLAVAFLIGTCIMLAGLVYGIFTSGSDAFLDEDKRSKPDQNVKP